MRKPIKKATVFFPLTVSRNTQKVFLNTKTTFIREKPKALNQMNQNKNKKCFLPFMGEGLRYEIREFITNILSPENASVILSDKEILAMTDIQDRYINGENLYKLV